MDLFSIAATGAGGLVALATEDGGGEATGLVINWFWILVSAANFLFFLFVLYRFALGPLTKLMDERKARIEEGLRDAEQARRDREQAETERVAALQEARREASEILARAQKVAQDLRDADIASTKAELERIRERATADIDAEKQRAIADLRNEVADLALRAASKVVGETLTTERERRLVAEFLSETTSGSDKAKS